MIELYFTYLSQTFKLILRYGKELDATMGVINKVSQMCFGGALKLIEGTINCENQALWLECGYPPPGDNLMLNQTLEKRSDGWAMRFYACNDYQNNIAEKCVSDQFNCFTDSDLNPLWLLLVFGAPGALGIMLVIHRYRDSIKKDAHIMIEKTNSAFHNLYGKVSGFFGFKQNKETPGLPCEESTIEMPEITH